MEYEIVINENENRFEARTNNSVIGTVVYVLNHNNCITVTHTGVAREYEGLGIAAKLNEALLNYALKKNQKVIPLCSYTKAYMMKHAEYRNLEYGSETETIS